MLGIKSKRDFSVIYGSFESWRPGLSNALLLTSVAQDAEKLQRRENPRNDKRADSPPP